MTEISMVSYCNPLSMYRQQQQAASTQQLSQQAQQHVQAHQHAHQQTPGQQYWYPGYPHHQPSGAQQYLDHSDVLAWPPHPHAHHYSHLQYQHHQMTYQSHQQAEQTTTHQTQISAVSDWSSDERNNPVGAGEPSPPITVSGSELSSPGTPSSPPANNNNVNAPNNNSNSASTTPMRPAQIRSPYEWMKKPSYQNQPNPGKTRTKDKYRVVYTDHQRLELEKEFHYSRYITIRRKAELAANLSLSERQVKIWFQNRRAKQRKQEKKLEEMDNKEIKRENITAGGMASLAALGGMGGMLGGLMHSSGSPPLGLGPPPALGLGHPGASLHTHQHPHAHTVLGGL